MSIKCKVEWVDCSGKPTPDDNDAIADAVLRADGRRFPVCAEHMRMVERARSHSGTCSHVTRFPTTWIIEKYPATLEAERVSRDIANNGGT